MEDFQFFFDLRFYIASICVTLAFVVILMMCTCLENKKDNRPKYMGCRPLTEEEVFGPVEKQPEIVIEPVETHRDEVVEQSPDPIANGHLNGSGRNKSATLNRQLPDIPAELPPGDTDPHNTYESTSELYATLDDTYSKAPTGHIDGSNTNQTSSHVEIYDPYSCVKDELKSSKVYQEVKERDESPSEQDNGYTKVLASSKRENKSHSAPSSRLGESSSHDHIPPIPDKHFDLLDLGVSDITNSDDAESGPPVSFNSIPMEMIDDTGSVNEDNVISAAGSSSKELSYTSISVREPLANLKAKQYESYYSVVHEDDTYAQVDNSPVITTVDSNVSVPVNLYAEIDVLNNSYAQVENVRNSESNSEVPPAPPTVESLRNITFHSKDNSEDVSESSKQVQTASAPIDPSHMYATVDKNKKTRKSIERDPRVNIDHPGLDLQEFTQILDNNNIHNNSRTPPFPINLYESTGARPKSFTSDLSPLVRINGIREDIRDTGYETIKDAKANFRDEIYDNIDKNYTLDDSNLDPRYNRISEFKNIDTKMILLDPEYETVFDAILNDKLDSDNKHINGQNNAESYYESVEQRTNNADYESIKNRISSSDQTSFISDKTNQHNYESVECLKAYSNEALRESFYDTGYEGVTIKKEVHCTVPNGPINSSRHSLNCTTDIVLTFNTQDNSPNHHFSSNDNDKKQDYNDR